MVAAYQAFSQASSTLAAPCVVTKPTGTVDGDLLTAYQLNLNPGNVVTAPAGWTLKAGTASADAIYERQASGEGANWTWQPAFLSGVHIVVVRSNGHSSSKTVAWSILGAVNAASHTIPSLTVPAGTGYLLLQVLVGQQNNTWTPPGGTTERFDALDSNGFSAAGGDQVVNAGATGTRVWTPSSTVSAAGFMVAIAPASVAQTVSPGGISSGGAVGTPTVTPGAVTISPGGINSGGGVGTPTVQPGAVTISPSGIGATGGVGTPTVTPGTVTVSPGGINSAATLGSPTVTAGPVTVSPAGIDSSAAVGTPTVTPGTVTVSPGGIDSSAALGSPTVTAGVATVSPGGIDSTALLGTPTIQPGGITVSPAGIDSTALLGAPTVTPGAVVIEPPGIDSSAQLGTPDVTAGGFTVSPSGIDSSATVGTPTVLGQPVITGVVRNHETGALVGAGVVVKLFDDNDLLVDTAVTAGDGSYIFYRPFGDADLYWTLATYTVGSVQYHGVSDRGCPAV